MNLADRIYLGVHLALTLLVCARYPYVAHWPWYVAWNALVIGSILLLARRQHEGTLAEFAHDWLPAILFITVFEEVSFLSLTVRGTWQNPQLIAWNSALSPASEWLHRFSSPWFVELLAFGYLSFYPLYPAIGLALWKWRRRPRFAGAFRSLTNAISVCYVICYAVYLLFPTRSPSHNVGESYVTLRDLPPAGPFHFLVRLVQGTAGVHGNAFPSAHIALAFAVLVFVGRYFPRLTPWIMVCVLLMCTGAVYDGYHYAIDVVAGALLGTAVAAAFVGSKQLAISNKQ